jgi:hypothetical protein
MKKLAIPVGMLVGVLVVREQIGLLTGVVLAASIGYLAFFAYCRLWVRRRFAARHRAYAVEHLDPDAAPPPGSAPVELELARRMDAIEDGDVEASRALYSEECEFYVPGRARPHSLARYLRVTRAVRGWLGEEASQAVSVLADPARRDDFWLVIRSDIRPRRGEPFEIEWLESWTLTPDHDRIRRRAVVAFTYVGETRPLAVAG